MGVAEEEGGGAETQREGDALGANAIVEKNVDGLLEVVDTIGDDATKIVAGLFGGEFEGGAVIAPIVEGLALVAQLLHDGRDRFALAQGFKSELLVMAEWAVWVWELEDVRAGEILRGVV